LYDFQGQVRRIQLKRRDDGAQHVLWVVAGTHGNRRAVREAAALVDEAFPVPARAALRALALGCHPGGSTLVFA
jgi:hypothetical protein